jgi:adenine-specific DNA-methyltransferase
VIKYLGSKRRLLPHIRAIVDGLPAVDRVVDLFSGTSRVSRALKDAGYDVVANDHNAYAHTLARCYVEADRETYLGDARALIEELATVPPEPGYVTRVFCEEARFFRPENGARIDAVRRRIAELDLPPILEAIALTALLEAADRVDSTVGVQMAYLKRWAPRALKTLELRVPDLIPGSGTATCLDALEAARTTTADLAYLDPPYNQHSYRANYHVWETIVLDDQPEFYGVARKRIDCRDLETKSPFNSKRKIAEALDALLSTLQARHLVVSFSNEGFLAPATMEAMLAPHGAVRVYEVDYDRYVGARTGIHNPQGERVGRVSHTKNKELLFVVTPDPASFARVDRNLSGLARRAS